MPAAAVYGPDIQISRGSSCEAIFVRLPDMFARCRGGFDGGFSMGGIESLSSDKVFDQFIVVLTVLQQ